MAKIEGNRRLSPMQEIELKERMLDMAYMSPAIEDLRHSNAHIIYTDPSSTQLFSLCVYRER